MTRKGRLGALVAVGIVLLIAVNVIVVDRQTEPAKADIGQVLNLPGGDIQVKEEGARTGRTIVLLHGFAASMHWWTPLAERLAGRFHIVRVDLLGHGGSQKPSTGYSMRNQGQLVATALSALGVRHGSRRDDPALRARRRGTEQPRACLRDRLRRPRSVRTGLPPHDVHVL